MLDELSRDWGVLPKKDLEEKYKVTYKTLKGLCSTFKIRANKPKNKACRNIKYTKIRDMEDEFIHDWVEGDLSIKELQDKYECPKSNLKTRARALDIKRKHSKDKIDIDTVIEEYNEGRSIRELSKNNHIDTNTLKNMLNDANVILRDTSQRCEKLYKDEYYFDDLDDQNKLYILGLLYADGCNYIDKYTISISLKEEDKYLLENINTLIKSDRPIKDIYNKTYDKNYSKLTISNKRLSLRLLELGMVKNKSLILKYPNFLTDEEMLRHFLRGYIDGDGCISCNIKSNRYSIGLSMAGTYDFLIGVQNQLIKLFKINRTKISKSGNIYCLSISQRYKVEEILDWLYSGANLYLIRKYNKYLEIKNYNKLHPIKGKMPKYYNYLDKEIKPDSLTA